MALKTADKASDEVGMRDRGLRDEKETSPTERLSSAVWIRVEINLRNFQKRYQMILFY